MVFADLIGYTVTDVREDTPLEGIELIVLAPTNAVKAPPIEPQLAYHVHGDYTQTEPAGLYSATELFDFLIANVKAKPRRVKSKEESA